MSSIVNWWRERKGVQFCALFAVWLAVFAGAFELARTLLVELYMYPISYVAAWILNGIGVQAALGNALLASGVCQLAVSDVVYLVTFECTGIFALFMCASSVLAYPASKVSKIKGISLVLPAFLAYSTLRLVVMGVVARFIPDHIELFHVYIMVLVNIGFVLLLWLYWVREMVPGSERA